MELELCQSVLEMLQHHAEMCFIDFAKHCARSREIRNKTPAEKLRIRSEHHNTNVHTFAADDIMHVLQDDIGVTRAHA